MSVAVVWFACLGCTCKEQLFETCLVDGFEIIKKKGFYEKSKDFMKMKNGKAQAEKK